MSVRLFCLAVGITTAFSACGGGDPPTGLGGPEGGDEDPVEVGSVTVEPALVAVTAGDSAQVEATVLAVDGTPLPDRVVRWSSSDVSTAVVSAGGWITGISPGSVTIAATVEGIEGTAEVTVEMLFAFLSAAGPGTFGVTSEGVAFVWGSNFGTAHGAGPDLPSSSILNPVRLDTSLEFSAIAPAPSHTCGIALDQLTYCWGARGNGRLGDGSATGSSFTPVRVLDDHLFEEISAGIVFTCGRTVTGQVLCWGNNRYAQFATEEGPEYCGGFEYPYRCSTRPFPVLDSLRFTSIAAGGTSSVPPEAAFVCGLVDGRAICWGRGALGHDTLTESPVPLWVDGDHEFRSIYAGGGHACALTEGGEAVCWGENHWGQVGNESRDDSALLRGGDALTPTVVAGGLRFKSLSLGKLHTCGVTIEGDGYCWGQQNRGALGDGSPITGVATARTSPSLIAGGHRFSQIAAGEFHTCGITEEGIGYCWGESEKLGNGTYDSSNVPVRVVPAPRSP